jgi:cytochrome c biogenesis protein CcmG/thiol:disulfide interchange protein DsbE
MPRWLAFGSSTDAKAAPPSVDFSLKDINDKNVSLSQFRGKVVFLDFWATDCGPCKVEIPWLIQMQQKYGSRGFTVLGIAMDEEGKAIVAPFVATNKYEVNGQKVPMNYPILIGNDDVTNKVGGVEGYPTGVLFARDGKQVSKFLGITTYEDLAKQIEAQL